MDHFNKTPLSYFNERYIKEGEMGRTSSTNGTKRNSYRILMGKPEGKIPLRRPRCRWVDNIKIDL
jgi:hypothetical protein